MCHALLHDPAFFRFLSHIDAELAEKTCQGRCHRCGGPLHVADFPRKPRGCPAAVREEYSALNVNGTYADVYNAKSGQARRQEGTWDLEYLQAGPTVVLNSFRSPFPEDGGRPGFYYLLAERSFGNLYLITNIDLNEGYKKQR